MTSSSPLPALEKTDQGSRDTRRSAEGSDLHQLLGLSPSSHRLETALKSFAARNQLEAIPPAQIKSYPDVVYFNLPELGISLQFHPATGYRPKMNLSEAQLDKTKLRLAAIDVYNHEIQDQESQSGSAGTASNRSAYAAFPGYPIRISSGTTEPRPDSINSKGLDLKPSTTGRDLVEVLGEPDRKGGGTGGGSVGVWIEWTQLGLMVEMASKGFDAWDKGGESSWRYCSIFERGVVAGLDEDDTQGDL